MSLYCHSSGSGPDLVLVHGWSWHGGIWKSVVKGLATRFRVWVPDLPGHGASRATVGESTLEGWMLAIKECVPASAIWIGWSLGGLIALTAAQAGFATGLVLLGTTPRFIRDVDWECAWPADEFERFCSDIDRDVAGTLERFASLHLGDGVGQRALLRELRVELSARGMPESQALKIGLDMLRDNDYRERLYHVNTPALVIHGGNDRVVFAEAGERLARALPHGRYQRIEGGGHALPLSHAEKVVVMIGEFAGG